MTRREFRCDCGSACRSWIWRKGRGRRYKDASSDRVLDPIWTTAGISRAHGYMVFDTPFALDAKKFRPQPQMVGDYGISTDQLVYSFTLRDGLRFHDGMPVGGVDCVASLRRWMVRDIFGQSLAAAVDQMGAVGDKGFTIRLKEPFPLLLDALSKIAGPPFIMPERPAKTGPYQQITDAVGSGPYKFVKEEFQPGHMAVYVKNPDYAAQ
jgi:peptide/nickel transport system substrate-binding protein